MMVKRVVTVTCRCLRPRSVMPTPQHALNVRFAAVDERRRVGTPIFQYRPRPQHQLFSPPLDHYASRVSPKCHRPPRLLLLPRMPRRRRTRQRRRWYLPDPRCHFNRFKCPGCGDDYSLRPRRPAVVALLLCANFPLSFLQPYDVPLFLDSTDFREQQKMSETHTSCCLNFALSSWPKVRDKGLHVRESFQSNRSQNHEKKLS